MPNLLGKIPWFRRLFTKGANTDVRGELQQNVSYYDALNMRGNSIDGNVGGMESVGGEEVRSRPSFDEQLIADSYTCIGACNVTGAEVSFWASINGLTDPDTFPVIIKINGVSMVVSGQIPYRYDRPLQFGDVSKCLNGMIFPTDGNSDPLLWDIPAIISAYEQGLNTYTTGLDLDSVTVGLAVPLEWPEHVGNPNVGLGLPIGQYQYKLRYVTPNGDRSNFGPVTPLISIPRTQAPIYTFSGQYPGGQTQGGPADTLVTSPYGIALRFQVDNYMDYASIEVVRTRFNDAQGLNGPGITEVIATIALQPGQFGLLDFVDPVDANLTEVIPVDEAEQEQVNITAPKTVEYTDNRVVYGNFKLKDRIAQLIFRMVDGVSVVPITNRVFTWYEGGNLAYNDGYSDPVNNTYMKGAQHNERYSLGIQLWDNTSTRSPVVPVQDNFQFPSKRTRKTGQSLGLSYNQNDQYGAPPDPIYAVDENAIQPPSSGPYDPVSPTFDCIVQGNTKKQNSEFTNVINGPNYNPFRPVSPTDPNFVRYKQKPITEREVSEIAIYPDSGAIFAPQYHALGCAIYGPTNLNTEAPWWKMMEVVVTPPAGRVIAEGIGAYVLNENAGAGSLDRGKSLNSLNCFFPDVYTGVVSQSVIDDIGANPSNYRLKLTPYGFYSETYAYRGVISPLPSTPTFTTYGQDIISYATMQFEPGTGNVDCVNIGDGPSSQGYQPGVSAPAFPTNYVGPDTWRWTPGPQVTDPTIPGYSVFQDPWNPAQGGYEFTISGVNPVNDGRGNYLRILTDENIYTLGFQNASRYFGDEVTRAFHQPMYAVQLIRSDAVVPEQNIQQYRSTGTRILRERTIALGQASGIVYDVDLFHARVEDCVPAIGSGQLRYVFVRSADGSEKPFICFTNAVLDFAAAQAAFSTDGFWVDPNGVTVYGAYSYQGVNSESTHIKHRLTFGNYGTSPAQGDRIVVKYFGDGTDSPIQTFGFDCTTSPAVFAPYDRTFNAGNGVDNSGGNNQVFNGAPLPYNGGIRASQYVLPRDGSPGGASIEPSAYINAVSLRQWVVWAELVTRFPSRLNVSVGQPEQYAFPHTHYIIRPSLWVTPYTGVGNGLDPQYDADYPLELEQNYGYGGFHFAYDANLDYAKKPLITGLGVPRNGQYQRTDYCTGFAASLRSDPQQIDSPGLRTFTWDNIFVASDENGELKMMHILNTNLFGVFEKGCAYIPYNKNQLTDADGNLVATQSIATFWTRPGGEQWVTRGNRGCPDQLWRFAVKAHDISGAETLWWADRVGVYQSNGRGIEDISRNRRLKKLYPLLQAVPIDYSGSYSGGYNYRNGEAWMRLGDTVEVFNAVNKEWTGSFGYLYDAYQSIDGQMIGYKELTSYDLDKGGVLITPTGDAPVDCYATTHFFEPAGLFKEAMQFRVVGTKPDYIEVYDENMVFLCRMDEATNGPLWTKNYDGWEGWISRIDPSVDPLRGLPQSRGFFIKAGWSTFGPKELTFMDSRIKNIK